MTKTTDDHSYRESGLENILLKGIGHISMWLRRTGDQHSRHAGIECSDWPDVG